MESKPSQEQLDTETKELPAGWTVQWSARENRRYYYRTHTSTTQWTKPNSTKTVIRNQRYTDLVTFSENIVQKSGQLVRAPIYLEEVPKIIFDRKKMFDELDANLTAMCQSAGLVSQPSMAFLRWRFCQRMLQSGPSFPQDPLLPVSPSIDSGLCHELVRERMDRKVALKICQQLAEETKNNADVLVGIRQKLYDQYVKEWNAGHTNSWGFRKTFPLNYDPIPKETATLSFQENNKKIIHVTCCNWNIPLNIERFKILKILYERHTEPVNEASQGRFLRRLWSMLARYDTIGGAGYQAALPEAAFDVLKKLFGVTHECFASPLNQYLDSYNSAFPDTDRFFGSRGSFFDMDVNEGSFEGNPPFVEEVMAAQALHTVNLLDRAEKANKAMCFIIIWPGWKDTPGFTTLTESKFYRKMLEFDKYKHTYKQGFQHQVDSNVSMYRASAAKTIVFILQSSAASKKWPVTSSSIYEFVQVFQNTKDSDSAFRSRV